jgi:hypothetical protein
MPRGNDTEHAKTFNKDTTAQYGVFPNADEMIRAHRASIDPAVTRASLLSLDEEATAEANEDLDALADKVDGLAEGDTIIGAAVRGNALVVVFVDEQGWTHKAVGGWTDKYEAPELTPAEVTLQAEAKRDALVRTETARLQAEADAQIAEAKAEADARVSEAVAQIAEDAQAEVTAAQEAAAEGDDSGEPEDKPAAKKRSSRAKKE